MKRTSILVLTAVALVLMLALAAPAATVNCSGVAAWSGNSVSYSAGQLVTYQGNEYKCLTSHTSQAGWDPVDAASLWSLQGSCGGSGGGGATPTPTSTGGGGCTPTAITPYIQVSGGAWQQTSSATVSAGAVVDLGPQPVSGGSWSWTGPNGFSSTARQIEVTVNSTSTYTATYTNPNGCKSMQSFTITVSGGGGGGCTPTAITPYIQVNGGAWQQTASVTVSSGSTVMFGPQPVSGGSWSWSGPNGFSSTSREVSFTANSSGNYTATYTNTGGCNSTQTFSVTVTSSGGGGGASGFIFSQYKDVTVDANWNTGAQQTTVTGASEPVTQAMSNSTLTWAFATGTCGSENWAGISPELEASNVQQFVNAGKKYIVSTGGANGSFDCPSASAFASFINTYNSSNMVGVDFDIEVGQGQAIIDDLINAVKGVEGQFPNMRFSFTVASLGSTASNPIFNATGVMVANEINRLGLGGNYTINPMAFDYGSANPNNCTVVNGACEMGQSAIAAMEAVNQQYGIPYGHQEVTVMVPADDEGETLTMGDVSTVCSWIKSNGVSGIHFWSFDRDTNLSYTNSIMSACGTN